ncbi:recombinase family protein [Kiloniella sp. EL199]|uniref:recombinase family protein n=1 Tax=Kiloniella sp. EL199 TaxID=2107581 RepID=UPI000EA36DD1|nr:recombinase family protein [Kiloniella sp. EL199]
MKIGYARVSGEGQNLDQQIAALQDEGCEKVFSEILASNRVVCPALEEALAELEAGDSLVVWRLDRLGRRTVDLITFLQDLQSREIYFQSLCEGLNSGTPLGKMFHGFIAALADNERDLSIERTLKGMGNAKSGKANSQKTKDQTEKARKVANKAPQSIKEDKGNKSKLVSRQDIEAAIVLLSPPDDVGAKPTLSAVAEALNISKATLSNRLKELELGKACSN